LGRVRLDKMRCFYYNGEIIDDIVIVWSVYHFRLSKQEPRIGGGGPFRRNAIFQLFFTFS
jgi:hypothetical protein